MRGASGIQAKRWAGVLSVCLLAVGCARNMKVPEKVAGNPVMNAQREGGLKENELRLGGAVASQIERNWSRPLGRGLVSFEKAPEETTLKFAFKEGQVALSGGCVEQLRTNLMGLKDPKVSLECSCKDGETLKGQLKLEQYQGKAELGGANSYQVYGVHTTTSGKKRNEVLGYWFLSKAGEGAIELKNDGRAWLPPTLSAEERPTLLCLYSALLLYRPSEAR
ncbi:MAG: hypothetical protein QM778_24905 [Myxococcales bacterium]